MDQDKSGSVQSPGPPRRSRFIHWILALALAAVFLYFSLRGIQWAEVWKILLRARLDFIALALAVGSVALFLRAVRWRILLRAQGPVDVPTAFWATSAGYFGNNFLPARAGELVRTMMVSSRTGLGKMFVLTTALSERLSDGLTLVLISSSVLLTLPVRPGGFERATKIFAIVGFSGALAIAVLPKLEWFWSSLIRRAPLPHALREKLIAILEQIFVGIRTFHDARRLLGFLGLTIVIWFLDAFGTIIGMHALGFSVQLAVAFLLIAGLGLGSALPSTPGYVGIYQFVAVSVLTPFGFSKTNAIAYILMAQALQYVMITFWGLIGLGRYRGIKLQQATGDPA